jgi:hypothetical protein
MMETTPVASLVSEALNTEVKNHVPSIDDIGVILKRMNLGVKSFRFAYGHGETPELYIDLYVKEVGEEVPTETDYAAHMTAYNNTSSQNGWKVPGFVPGAPGAVWNGIGPGAVGQRPNEVKTGELEDCPKCGGGLDTGMECIKCDYDATPISEEPSGENAVHWSHGINGVFGENDWPAAAEYQYGDYVVTNMHGKTLRNEDYAPFNKMLGRIEQLTVSDGIVRYHVEIDVVLNDGQRITRGLPTRGTDMRRVNASEREDIKKFLRDGVTFANSMNGMGLVYFEPEKKPGGPVLGKVLSPPRFKVGDSVCVLETDNTRQAMIDGITNPLYKYIGWQGFVTITARGFATVRFTDGEHNFRENDLHRVSYPTKQDTSNERDRASSTSNE